MSINLENNRFWVRSLISITVFGALVYGFFKVTVPVEFFMGLAGGGIFQWYFDKDSN